VAAVNQTQPVPASDIRPGFPSQSALPAMRVRVREGTAAAADSGINPFDKPRYSR